MDKKKKNKNYTPAAACRVFKDSDGIKKSVMGRRDGAKQKHV